MDNPTLSFDHVHLVSRDPVAAADWYVEKLDGRITASTQVRGAPQVLIYFSGAMIIIRGRRTGESAIDKAGLQWGVDHFGFQVSSDFDSYCKQLKSKGVVFTLEPVDFGPELRIAFIQAPDGVIIELLHRKGKASQ
jgi:catechol 2,3-dioxygenase-like lactoylglutathione lyase family enzyme